MSDDNDNTIARVGALLVKLERLRGSSRAAFADDAIAELERTIRSYEYVTDLQVAESGHDNLCAAVCRAAGVPEDSAMIRGLYDAVIRKRRIIPPAKVADDPEQLAAWLLGHRLDENPPAPVEENRDAAVH